jgi:heme exporter protein A
MLTLDKINYSKNQKKIISNLGFTIGLNSCLTISGKNGSGKTTLLKIIAGLTSLGKPEDSGQILWNNEDIENIKEDFYSDIQYLGHNNFLKKDLSVLDNLLFYARLSDSEILVPSAIRYFKLDNILYCKVGKLSAGWQKRVMLAKLLCCPSTIWLLDEPTINLDKDGKELLFNLVSTRIKEEGIVLIATHDDLFSSISANINLEDFNDHDNSNS